MQNNNEDSPAVTYLNAIDFLDNHTKGIKYGALIYENIPKVPMKYKALYFNIHVENDFSSKSVLSDYMHNYYKNNYADKSSSSDIKKLDSLLDKTLKMKSIPDIDLAMKLTQNINLTMNNVHSNHNMSEDVMPELCDKYDRATDHINKLIKDYQSSSLTNGLSFPALQKMYLSHSLPSSFLNKHIIVVDYVKPLEGNHAAIVHDVDCYLKSPNEGFKSVREAREAAKNNGIEKVTSHKPGDGKNNQFVSVKNIEEYIASTLDNSHKDFNYRLYFI